MDNVQTTWQMVKRLCRLYMESARLVVAERLTRLLASTVLFLVMFFLAVAALVMVSILTVRVLMDFIPELWCYLIIIGFYVILMILAYALRRPLIINPISRFISILILDPPTPTDNNDA